MCFYCNDAVQVLKRHPDTYFLLLGREHPSERLAGRMMKNLIAQVMFPSDFCSQQMRDYHEPQNQEPWQDAWQAGLMAKIRACIPKPSA